MSGISNPSDEKSRMKAILASDTGKAMPTLAAHLAYETEFSSEPAVKILAAAHADFLAVKEKQATVSPPAIDPIKAAADYQAQKTAAGALGLGMPGKTGSDRPDAASLWSKAVTNANASMGIK